MGETPTFGRYAEIPYDKMTREQQEGYRALLEARGRLPGPARSTCTTQARESAGAARRALSVQAIP
jgi:hypothetical protein